MSMTTEEILKRIEELRAEKHGIMHEIEQSDKHITWHENRRRRLWAQWESRDAEQWPLVRKELGING